MENNNQNNNNEVTPEVTPEVKEETVNVVEATKEEVKTEEVKPVVEVKKENINYNKKDNRKEKHATINVTEVNKPEAKEKEEEEEEEKVEEEKKYIVNIESFNYIIPLGGMKGPVYSIELSESSIKTILEFGEPVNTILPNGKRFYLYTDINGNLITE